MTQIVDIMLLTLLACTAMVVLRMRSLWAAVMLTGIYSFLGAGWMLILDAPDVAFTEAAVGAGIATVLMLEHVGLDRYRNEASTGCFLDSIAGRHDYRRGIGLRNIGYATLR